MMATMLGGRHTTPKSRLTDNKNTLKTDDFAFHILYLQTQLWSSNSTAEQPKRVMMNFLVDISKLPLDAEALSEQIWHH